MNKKRILIKLTNNNKIKLNNIKIKNHLIRLMKKEIFKIIK